MIGPSGRADGDGALGACSESPDLADLSDAYTVRSTTAIQAQVSDAVSEGTTTADGCTSRPVNRKVRTRC